MCDYGDYEAISRREVTTRKKRSCDSCTESFPAGTRMMVYVGKSEGDIGRTYGCRACVFANNQEDETPLHLCWGWGHDPEDYGMGDPKETWAYINATLAKGETPTVEGVKAHHAALQTEEE